MAASEDGQQSTPEIDAPDNVEVVPIAGDVMTDTPVTDAPVAPEPLDAAPLDAMPFDAEPLDAEPLDAMPLDAAPLDTEIRRNPRPDFGSEDAVFSLGDVGEEIAQRPVRMRID